MAIYTKKGDKGETKVFDKKTGELVAISKKSCKIRAIGAIDELNSFLGIVEAEIGNQYPETSSSVASKSVSRNQNLVVVKKLREIQGNLFVINSILAGSNLGFDNSETKKLEREIDEWEGTLPVLKNFIFYGGGKTATHIFYARALSRRAERSLVAFKRKYPEVNDDILKYFNRLSDYLFMMARKANFDEKVKEDYWIGKKNR